MRYAVLAIAMAAMALPALARPVEETDRAEVGRLLVELEDSVMKLDMERTVALMPAPIFDTLAEMNGVTTDQLRTAMDQAAEQALSSVEFLSATFDMDGATEGETSSGRPYIQIPSIVDMDVNGAGKVRSRSTVLALEDGGSWYLLRVEDEAQKAALAGAYPDFDGVEFPQGSLENIE